jgi:hypothetical protein
LGHNDVRTGLYRFVSLRNGLHLADEPRAGSAYGWGERPWIAKRKHDGGGPVSKRTLQDLRPLGETPRDKAAPDPGIARNAVGATGPNAIRVSIITLTSPSSALPAGPPSASRGWAKLVRERTGVLSNRSQ